MGLSNSLKVKTELQRFFCQWKGERDGRCSGAANQI